jgi:hypothetical protein
MTPPARMIRVLGLAIVLVTAGGLVATLLVREYEVATLILVGVGWLLLVASIVSVVLRRRDDARLRDASHSYYLQPPLVNVALALFYGVMAVGAVAFGIGFFTIGNVGGWGLVFCGSAGLVLLTFEIWVARRPFGDVEKE